MRILLINPPTGSIYHFLRLKTPPLGLAYIASVLLKAGHQLKIADLNVEGGDYSSLSYAEYDAVEISVETMRYLITFYVRSKRIFLVVLPFFLSTTKENRTKAKILESA